jgi:hypothetical protein
MDGFLDNDMPLEAYVDSAPVLVTRKRTPMRRPRVRRIAVRHVSRTPDRQWFAPIRANAPPTLT